MVLSAPTGPELVRAVWSLTEANVALTRCGPFQTAALVDFQRPGFQGEGLPAASEDRVGPFVEQLAHHAATLLGDPTRPVDLTGPIAPRHKADVGADIARLSEATGFIDRHCEGGGGLDAHAGETRHLLVR